VNKELEWYAKLLKQDTTFDCCCWFWYANSLQNILNEPLQYCGYCGRKLTQKEFTAINNRQFPKRKIREGK